MSLVQKFITSLFILGSSSSAFAECSFNLRYDEVSKMYVLRIDNRETKQWTRVTLPENLYPLQIGKKVEFKSSFSSEDVASIEYDGDVLVFENVLRSNFSKDKVVMETTSVLKQIGAVEYKRRMLYGLSLIAGSETFTCP